MNDSPLKLELLMHHQGIQKSSPTLHYSNKPMGPTDNSLHNFPLKLP